MLSTSTALRIKKDLWSRWVSPDGLCKLTADDNHPPFGEGYPATVNNENGILYLAYVLMLCDEQDALSPDDSAQVFYTMSLLEREPGLYLRHPGHLDRDEAQDDYVGICLLSTLFNGPWAERICQYGDKFGWCFNTSLPGTWKVTTLRQMGEIALYKICGKRVPYVTEMLGWVVGTLINAFTSNMSNKNLSYARFRALFKTLEQEKLVLHAEGRIVPQTQPAWVKGSVYITAAIYALILKIRFGKDGTRVGFFKAFDINHPIFRLAELK